MRRHLEPLAFERQALERLERILQLQVKWAVLARDGCHLAPKAIMESYEAEAGELQTQFVLSFQDYLKQRLSDSDEGFAHSEMQKQLAHFHLRLEKERASWPAFAVPGENVKEYVSHLDAALDECVEGVLRVESEQLEKIGIFEALQTFWCRSLESESKKQRQLSVFEAEVEEFCKFCEEGNLEEAKRALRERATKKKRQQFLLHHDSSGATGVHLAARFGHAPLLEMLLDIGFPIDFQDQWHHLPPVFWAVSRPSVPCEAILKTLQAYNGLAIKCRGKNALHFAVQFGNFSAVVFLVDAGVLDIDEPEDKTGRTPLHLACSKGFMGITSYLLSQGAK